MKKSLFIILLFLTILGVLYLSNNSLFNNQMLEGDISEMKITSSDTLTLLESELLVDAEGILTVRAHCTGCHSEKLVTQNRATREGWENMIRWMQKTQNLGDLGGKESEILDYLAANYAPEDKGRRAPLQVEWYVLSE